jgi:hypothetical protein
MPMAIRAVIFDIGGVLQRRCLSERRAQVLAGVGLTEHSFDAIARGNPIMQQSFIGKASHEEASAAFAKELCERFSIPGPLWRQIIPNPFI